MLLELCPATINADLQPNRAIMAISIVVLGTTETILACPKGCLWDPDCVLGALGVTPCQSGSKRRGGGFDTRTVFTRETDTDSVNGIVQICSARQGTDTSVAGTHACAQILHRNAAYKLVPW
jgi:hypothetical protein